MVVRVKGYLTFHASLGERLVEVSEGTTLLTLVDRIALEAGQTVASQLMDEQGMLRKQVAVLVNGHHYTDLPDGLETRLDDGDDVAIFPPMMGG